MKFCSICKAPHKAKGYCAKHYEQTKRHGTVLSRTVYTNNDVSYSGDYCVMNLYNRKNQKVAETIFNSSDHWKVIGRKWHLNSMGYACSHGRLMFHSAIMGHRPGFIVDHIDGNPLNNKRSNLRFVTWQQNAMNRPSVGVSRRRSKWFAYISLNYKQINLGAYKDIADAINARKEAERHYFGEFARSA